jgi:hypothetical protein
MSSLYRGSSIDASYQVSIHLAKRFKRRRFFRNQPIRNKNGLWRSCLLTDRDEMCNLYRGPAIDASYQVSVHLAKRFQMRRFLKIGQSETRIAYGGHVCWWIGTKWAIFIQVKLTNISYIGTLFKVKFIKDSVLLRVSV